MSGTTTSLRRVAVVGAGGLLGGPVLTALRSETFKSAFSDVVLLKRSSGTSTTEAPPRSDGVTIQHYDEENIESALANIDILINLIGPKGHATKDAFLKAIPKSQVKLYIPSEFGVDHDVHDFPHAEWDQKKHHAKLAKQVLTHTKMCRIFVGLFTEESIGPWFGLDGDKARYQAIGSADTLVSFSSLQDVGMAVASVCRLPYESVPERMHISSDTVSIRDVAHIMEQAGSPHITIEEIELAAFKEKTLASSSADPSQYLRFLVGEGKIKHTSDGLGNDNELVNPGESLWKWHTLTQYAQETNGHPWAGSKWTG